MPRDQWRTQNRRAADYQLDRDATRALEAQAFADGQNRTPVEEFIDRKLVAEIRRWVAILEGRERSDVPRSLTIGCLSSVKDYRLRYEMEQVLRSTSSDARKAAAAALDLMKAVQPDSPSSSVSQTDETVDSAALCELCGDPPAQISRMTLNDISGQVVDAAIAVHKALGPGLLESAYQACLAFELRSRGIEVLTEVPLPVVYRGERVEVGYRIDLLVAGQVIVEVKSVESLAPIHTAQVLTYLRLANQRLGLLLNFNVLRMTDGIRRLVHELPE